MSQSPTTVETALQALKGRLEAMNSDELGRVAELARAGRTAVWRIRQGKSGARVPTILRIEQAASVIESERPTPAQAPA